MAGKRTSSRVVGATSSGGRSSAVLLRFDGTAAREMPAMAGPLGAAGTSFELETLFDLPPASTTSAMPSARARGRIVWKIARPKGATEGSPWDVARAVAAQVAATGMKPSFVEPDLEQIWPHRPAPAEGPGVREGDFHDQDSAGGAATVPGVFAWHLGDGYSQLEKARMQARGDNHPTIRIAHLDTGYDLTHPTFPKGRFRADLARQFLEDGRPADDVRDIVKSGPLKNPGHGTGTLSILAGERHVHQAGGYDFDDLLGAAPDAQIIGLRVGNSVVQFKTSSVARAIEYAARLCENEESRVHVLSMSMGGVASQAWADAVNAAYLRGIVLVTAAGNNFSAGGLGGVPTTTTIYPARFKRVLAACGVMANDQPYYGLSMGTMQGNWGPPSKRETSLSAYTPNMPWARLASKLVDMDGAGTSAATPQIAAAAALYLQHHGAQLFDRSLYRQPWMIVEAVRLALLASARNTFDSDTLRKLGGGIVQAATALTCSPMLASQLRQTPADRVSFPFLSLLTGLGVTPAVANPMLEIELAQLVQSWEVGKNPFDELLMELDESGTLSVAGQKEVLENLVSHRDASDAARGAMQAALEAMAGSRRDRTGGGRERRDLARQDAPAPAHQQPTDFQPVPPRHLELRGYAMDPGFATSFKTVGISETIFQLPWPAQIDPGPVDEYIEVIDIDPASDCVYEPVDLMARDILATRGLPPSEGTPQFHQQMVYSVARLTIDHFERALGRLALWRHGPGKHDFDDSQYVQRLRIYPHALRQDNAYYSPARIALLFGYFGSHHPGSNAHTAGDRIFTCLSHDIIAHETTHALLDGMHKHYLSNTNPDVLAFHEAFADIVALFQRLSFPDLLRHEIARVRGEIRSRRSLLGELATQFGQALYHRRALREAIGQSDKNGRWIPRQPSRSDYQAHKQPHARGSVLVAAVFDAFISIYEKRSEDLVRIATEGTGILRPGALHPDLVERLSHEASSSARHVLTMCIRALDYCPPTDITFGEYLRAIITADCDVVPDDRWGYRIAFIEAFRNRGISVEEVRTMSVESLLWRRIEPGPRGFSQPLLHQLGLMRQVASANAFGRNRRDIFEWQREARRDIQLSLRAHFLGDKKNGPHDARLLGLDPEKNFEVHSARFALREGPDGRLTSQALIGILQRDRSNTVAGQPFEGGSTVIADLATRQIRYVIRKSTASQTRLARQRDHALNMRQQQDESTYFHGGDDEPFAALHQCKGGR